MKNRTHIGVTIHYDQGTVDLSIPIHTPIYKLKKLLIDTLFPQSKVLAADFQLTVLNKPLNLDDEYPLSVYPVGEGDQLAFYITNEMVEE